MTGTIEDIPLADVLQWLAQSRRTGTLKVRGGDHGQSGALMLREGRVFNARIDDRPALRPEKALFRMLGWSQGMFELDASDLDDIPVEIDMSLEHLLMDAARQHDELAALAAKTTLPTPATEIILVRPSPVRWTELAEHELRLVQDLFERESWFDVLDASASEDLELTRTLIELAERGVVEIGD
jgi:hypothetical protein